MSNLYAGHYLIVPLEKAETLNGTPLPRSFSVDVLSRETGKHLYRAHSPISHEDAAEYGAAYCRSKHAHSALLDRVLGEVRPGADEVRQELGS